MPFRLVNGPGLGRINLKKVNSTLADMIFLWFTDSQIQIRIQRISGLTGIRSTSPIHFFFPFFQLTCIYTLKRSDIFVGAFQGLL